MTLPVVVAAVGLVLLSAGVGLVSPAAALIVDGVLLIAAAYVAAYVAAQTRKA